LKRQAQRKIKLKQETLGYIKLRKEKSGSGLKAHIGVDARTGLIHCVSTTATNAHDTTETANLIMAKNFFSAKSGYRGA